MMRSFACFLILAVLPAPAVGADGPDVRVVYWYDRARPLDTFEFQAYDLRKKEYTPAVERWLAALKRDFPGYEAYTRDVVLAREQGHTDNLKIGSAVLREFYLLGDRNGYTFAGMTTSTVGPPPRLSGAARPAPTVTLPRVGSSSPQPSVPAFSPFPVPYPRPHP